MERALAALAGSGLDSTRFTVLAEVGDARGRLDRSMTSVLAVPPGGIGMVLDDLDAGGSVAWVADPSAAPGGASTADAEPVAEPVAEPMSDWSFGTVADLRAEPPIDADRQAGWLIVEAEVPGEASDAEVTAAIEELLAGGTSPSRAAKEVARRFGVPKRRVYELALRAER
ncbi:MAG: hypothetical protein GX471_10170 [Candidatus Microthrix parvicella]|jgi:hypothetical protein|nr:hypothetical protein [Candidatus Microthrix sp.]MBK7323108.1 hypothetical protein [Candidatus Microthrix sp.]NLH66524.1 hypothetical protein [Candidatus Microthrix parvicella]